MSTELPDDPYYLRRIIYNLVKGKPLIYSQRKTVEQLTREFEASDRRNVPPSNN